MSTVFQNLALMPDLSSSRTLFPEKRVRLLSTPSTIDAAIVIHSKVDAHTTVRRLGEARRRREVLVRGKANSRVNSVDGENGNDFEDEEDGLDPETGLKWDEEMRRMVKELEEMKDLERKAEELQEMMEGSPSGEDETEEEKRTRVRKELEKVAREQAETKKTAQLMFEIGQKAYGKGMYRRAIEFFEAALTIVPRSTVFGGEIQIWLAMAYDANNRHKDCIELYRKLELTHPSLSIRRQAADLRYILQAPKLKISEEEMVYFPLIGSSYDSYASSWSDKYKDKDQKRTYTTTNQLPSTKDYVGDFLVWRPPIGWEKNRVFWVILALWLGLVATALILQR